MEQMDQGEARWRSKQCVLVNVTAAVEFGFRMNVHQMDH
jgi:hypothetical protein